MRFVSFGAGKLLGKNVFNSGTRTDTCKSTAGSPVLLPTRKVFVGSIGDKLSIIK